MLEWLVQLDRTVFLFVNTTLANPATDWIMPVVTNDNFLRGIYVLSLLAILAVGRKRVIWMVLFSAVTVALTDQSSSALLKPLFGRLRPCQVMPVHLLVRCGAGFSFPSSHAANLFGQALFVGLLYKKYLPYLAAFAFLIGASRIFVGVHYPLDMLGGMALGTAEGAAMVWLYRRLMPTGGVGPKPDQEPME